MITIVHDTSDDRDLRLTCAQKLKQRGELNIENLWLKILRNSGEAVSLRIVATEALSKTKSKETLNTLVLIAQQDSEDDLRRIAINILGHSHDEQVLPVLASLALHDVSDDVRKRALEELATSSWPEDKVIEPFISALDENDPATRIAATQALEYINSPLSVRTLISLLEDPDAEVSETVVLALQAMGGGVGKQAKLAIRHYYWRKKGIIKYESQQTGKAISNTLQHVKQSRIWKVIEIITTLLLVVLIIAGGIYIFRPAPEQVPLLDHYPYSSKLVLDDPLKNNRRGYEWDSQVVTGPGAFACRFYDGTYYAVAVSNGSAQNCTAAKPLLKNFTYEVQVTLVEGDLGGIVFRFVPSAAYNYYYAFYIDTEGRYLVLAVYPNGSLHILLDNTSSAIHRGYHQANLLAVSVYGNQIKCYINAHELGYIHYQIAGTDGQGRIGVSVVARTQPTIAMFSNARVWKLSDTSSGNLP